MIENKVRGLEKDAQPDRDSLKEGRNSKPSIILSLSSKSFVCFCTRCLEETIPINCVTSSGCVENNNVATKRSHLSLVVGCQKFQACNSGF